MNAQEALDNLLQYLHDDSCDVDDAVRALRAALAAPQAQPEQAAQVNPEPRATGASVPASLGYTRGGMTAAELSGGRAAQAQPTAQEAFAAIKAAIASDPGYAWSWHCNVAMPFMDAWPGEKPANLHQIANAGAAKFMSIAFDVDVREFDEWKSISAQWAAQAQPQAGQSAFPFVVGNRQLVNKGHAQALLRCLGKDMKDGAFGDPMAMELVAAYIDAIEAAPSPAAPVVPDRQTLVDLFAERLTGIYHCTRVWSAWGVGTMSEDDFSDAGDSETPTELADAVLAMLAASPTPPAQPAQPEAGQVGLKRTAINELMVKAGWQNSAIRQADLDAVERLVRLIESRFGIPAAKAEGER